jgi:hypothetical protein
MLNGATARSAIPALRGPQEHTAEVSGDLTSIVRGPIVDHDDRAQATPRNSLHGLLEGTGAVARDNYHIHQYV